MPDPKYLALLREVERLRDEMKAAQGEGSRIDPLRVAIALSSIVDRYRPKEFKDSGFTDDFGVHME